jgi:hypothetical protein
MLMMGFRGFACIIYVAFALLNIVVGEDAKNSTSSDWTLHPEVFFPNFTFSPTSSPVDSPTNSPVDTPKATTANMTKQSSTEASTIAPTISTNNTSAMVYASVGSTTTSNDVLNNKSLNDTASTQGIGSTGKLDPPNLMTRHQCFLLPCHLVNISSLETSSSNVFWSGMNSEQLLSFIEKAERELKIFVYPIPDSDALSSVRSIPTLPHFRAEYV